MSELIVGFGEALVDVLPSGEVVGGAPLNFSLRAAQLCQPLGWTAAMVSRLGVDKRGEQILELLRESSLDTSAIQVDSQRPTGFVNVTLDDGHPSYEIGKDVAWDAIAFDEPTSALARRASAVCFGTLAQRSATTHESLLQFLNTADRAVKVLDINLREPFPELEIIRSSLSAADVLKCNEEELVQLADWLQLAAQKDAVAIAEELQNSYSLRSVFWTRGSRGCVLQRGRQLVDAVVPQDLPQDPNADSVGAGDAASAALVVGLVADWPAEKLVRLANYCGAFVASRRGGTEPLPNEILSMLG